MIGVVPQHNNLDRDLTVAENLKVHGLLFGMRGRELDQRIDEVLDTVDLREQKMQTAVELSGGLKRRAVIARALLHRPRILFLDEPSAGLDPMSRRGMHALVRTLNHNAGVCVFLTTHYIEEADALASRVVLINDGLTAATDRPEALKASIGRYAVEYVEDGAYRTLYFEDRETAVREAATCPHDADVHIREVTLEDAYMKLTGKKLEGSRG